MLYAGMAFLFGILSLGFWAELPPVQVSFLLLLSLPIATLYPKLRLLGILLSGFCWALFIASTAQNEIFPKELDKQEFFIEGLIASIPTISSRSTRFEFIIDTLPNNETELGKLTLPVKVRLDWYGQVPNLSVAERWQFLVRLKAPHGFMNPGGFDYEGWLFQQGIKATGYIRSHEQNTRLQTASSALPITQIRQTIFNRLISTFSPPEQDALRNIGVLAALIMAERQFISSEQWDLFRQTGTSHLMAISGLHIGLIAGMTYFLMMRVFSRLLLLKSLTLSSPAQQLSAVAALLMAAVYAALADFTVPTTRALIMLAVVFSGLLLRRELRPGQGISLALLIILIWDPLAAFSAGFWLSFIAVAALLLMLYGRKVPASKLLHWSTIQLRLALVLLPVTLIWFQQAAITATAANLLAIPLVGMLIVPMSLLAVVFLFIWEPAGAVLLVAADFLVDYLMIFLDWVAAWPFGQWQQQSPPLWTWLPAGIGAVLLLMPRGFPARWLAIVFMLPIFFVLPQRPEEGELHFTILDVGQGLSAVVETKNHILVYDAGAQFTEDFDAGNAVLVPFLRNQNIRKIDKVVASHADDDHVGGLKSLLAEIPAKEIISGLPKVLLSKYSIHSQACHEGQHWQWDGISFSVLHPPPENTHDFIGNDSSCVIKIESADGSILLTGDIEKKAERHLLTNEGPTLAKKNLRVDILTAPHHGSRTSSTQGFVDAVQAQYIVFSVGHHNRFGFPKADVVARYNKYHSVNFNTSETGALTFTLSKAGIQHTEYRQQYQRFWHWKKTAIDANE